MSREEGAIVTDVDAVLAMSRWPFIARMIEGCISRVACGGNRIRCQARSRHGRTAQARLGSFAVLIVFPERFRGTSLTVNAARDNFAAKCDCRRAETL